MNLNKKIYVAGHRGMVGSAIVRQLRSQGFENLILRSHSELDLTDQQQVANFFKHERPDEVYLAAARVGGIFANDTFPGEFIYENLMIQSNVIHQAFLSGVKKLLFLGSSCIYPRLAPQPMSEDVLLTGKLEPTNEPYAVAKIAGIKMCESYNRQYTKSHQLDYRSVMPTNLYGPGDNYHPDNSHVIPALIRRFHEAKINHLPQVVIWGSGLPKREFLYVDDMAAASVFVMQLDKARFQKFINPRESHINIGYGIDIEIRELAKLIAKVTKFNGKIDFDPAKPDGMPRKLLSSNLINQIGWEPKTDLESGLKKAYDDFVKNL